MTHAFLIIVHAYPVLLKTIVCHLAAENHYFFINIDKKVDDKPFKAELVNFNNVYFLEGKDRICVNHGCFSQIKVELALLLAAKKFNPDYYHLISGQDFPCVSSKSFDLFFEKHNGESFMHYDSDEEHKDWSKHKYPNRYRRYWFNDFFIINPNITRILKFFINFPFRYLFVRPEIDDVSAGWNWFSWHKSVANYVLYHIYQNKQYLKRFRYTHCCDEIIFHTLLNKVTASLNINRYNCLRFIEWHPRREYTSLPLILDEREYKSIVKSGCLFCRKVHPNKSRILIMMLKRHINL